MNYNELINKRQTEDCKISDTNWFDEDNEDLQALRASMQARYDGFQRVIETINAAYDCSLRMTCEACPVQVEGTVDGNGLYFRARWDACRIPVGVTCEACERSDAGCGNRLGVIVGWWGLLDFFDGFGMTAEFGDGVTAAIVSITQAVTQHRRLVAGPAATHLS